MHLLFHHQLQHTSSVSHEHPGLPALEAQTMATSFDAFAALMAVTPLRRYELVGVGLSRDQPWQVGRYQKW